MNLSGKFAPLIHVAFILCYTLLEINADFTLHIKLSTNLISEIYTNFMTTFVKTNILLAGTYKGEKLH